VELENRTTAILPGRERLWATALGQPTEVLDALGQGDEPRVIVLTCTETGFASDQLSRALPGEVYVVQNLGGFVPNPSWQHASSAVSSIQFGLQHDTVKHLVICGHVRCRCLHFANHNTLQNSTDDDATLVSNHVLQQVDNALRYYWLRNLIWTNQLRVHAWLLDDDTARIATYSPKRGDFVLA